MSDSALERARAGDEEAFAELVDPYRRELQLHCYRILGSLQDAEDQLQETLLAAWRGLERFEERASLRAWLYRIATNRCLNALRDRGRRPQEVPGMVEPPEPTRRAEPMWLEPYPDVLLEGLADEAPGPEARYETRESVGLAFMAGLQHMPPRQRAALVLRDVLGFRAAEVAEMLDSSEASVKGALRRARVTLDERLPAGAGEHAALPRSPRQRDLVGRFAAAVERGDTDSVVALLTDDAWLTMPPEPYEYQGGTGDRPLLGRPRDPSRWAPPACPHRSQRPTRLRLLPGRSAGADSPRLRPDGPHDDRRPDLGHHLVRRAQPVPALRPPPHDPPLVPRHADDVAGLDQVGVGDGVRVR